MSIGLLINLASRRRDRRREAERVRTELLARAEAREARIWAENYPDEADLDAARTRHPASGRNNR